MKPIKGICAVLVLSAACGGAGAPGSGEGASISIALTSIPTDVQCLEVDVLSAAATQALSQRFDVAAGLMSVVTMSSLPSGVVSVNVLAFSSACASVSGTPPNWVASQPAQVTLLAGQTAAVTIILRRASGLQVTADFQDGTVAASPTSLAFGAVSTGSISSPQFVTVANGTTTAFAVQPTISATADGPQFVIAGGTCTTVPLPAGSACTVGVAFAPSSVGAKAATLTIGGGSASISLSGTATPAGGSLTVNPPALVLGDVATGFPFGVPIAVTNNGAVGVALVPAFTGPDAALFQVLTPVGTNACLPTTTLAPGGACTLTVGFNFTTTGLRSATLTLGNPVLASVPITATAQAPLLATSTANLTFPTTTVGQSSTQSFTVTNTSGTSQPVSFVMADPSDSAFSIPPSGLGSACGAVLAAGATCTLTVLYQPTVPGTQVQHVILLTGTPPVTQLSVRLSGTGSAAGLAVNPTSLPLGSTPTGIGFGIPIAVTNNGTVSVALVPAFTGPDAALFQVVVLAGTPSPCAPTTTLAPGAACTLMVGFTFTTTGNKSATLTLGNPVLASVPITATAVPPTLTTSTTSLIFPTTTIGQSSTQSFTVTNTSSTSQPLSFVMADGSTSPFSFPSSGLGSACGAVLAAGATCSLSVRYQPTVAGLQVQQVILSTGTPPLPQVAVVLNGTGSAAGLTVSPTSGPLGNVATGLNLAVAFTVNNIGSVAVPLVPAFTGPDAGQFQVVVPAGTTSPCVPTTTLAPGASCTLSVAFNFTTTGAKSATVTLGNPVLASVPLTATAVTPALRTSVPSLTFQPQTVGTAGTQALTVTNTTAATVALTIVTADGSSSPFSIQTGLSGACGATLAANASCSLTIRYLPVAVGVQTEQILLSTGGTPPALQAVVALSGTGR